MSELAQFVFGIPPLNDQLLRLRSRHWGVQVNVPGEKPQDTGVQIAVEEMTQVLSSIMDRTGALATYVNEVTNVVNEFNIESDQPPGYTGTVLVPLTYTVAVVGCTATVSVATWSTLTFFDGRLVGVA